MMGRLLVSLALLAGCGGGPARVVPGHGRQSGGETIRIQGDDFVGHGPPAVFIGNRAAKMVVVESRWLITVMTPQTDDPTTVDVRVVFEDGTALVVEDAFTYEEEKGIVLQPEIGG
jgi:hypothetical protein